MKKDILMGVIGTGRIGKLHVENINRLVPGGRVIAVADVMIEQSRAWAEEEGIKYIYNDYNELSDAVKITAKGANLLDPAIGEAGDIDTAVVTLEMANGAIAVIDNSRQAVYGYDQRVEVFGSKGQAIAYNDKPSTVELYTEETVSTDKIRYFFLDR